MARILWFTDEDVYANLAARLRACGGDAVSTPEMNRRGASDEQQLEWAAGEGRVIVTFNPGDYVRLHAAWLAAGQDHAGIVVSAQRPLGAVLKALLRLAAALDADALKNRLEFLSNW